MKLTQFNKSKKTIFTSSLILSSLLLSGCTEYLSDITIPNPFEQKEANTADAVYYGHFSDIPIPVDMEKDMKNTKVVFYNDNVSGIEIYEGRVEINSLSAAMEHNLLKNNWTLIAKEYDEKIMQIYQKDNRFAIITFYNQTLTTGMDVWVLDKLPQNIINSTPYPPATSSQNSHLTPNSTINNMKSSAVETIDTTVDKVESVYTNTVKPTVQNAKDKVVETYNTVETSLESSADDASITIDTTKQEVKDDINAVKEDVKETASDIIL